MDQSIYLVEDDVALSEGLAILLTNEGYDVKTFSDFRSMRRLLKIQIPDLFVLDYRLPGENGVVITKFLKANKKTKNIPIIIMSATQPNLLDQINDVPLDAYFPKPFEMDIFLQTVKNFTQKN